MRQIKDYTTFSRRFVAPLAGLLLGWSIIYSLFHVASYFGLSFFLLSNKNMVNYTVSSTFISATFDPVVWSTISLIVLLCLAFSLLLLKKPVINRLFISAALLGLFGWIFAVFFGFLSVATLVFTSILILVICFSFDFFGISRFTLLRYVLIGFALIASAVEIAALFLYNLPLTFGFTVLSPNSEASRLTELSLSNLAYPLLPYAYLLLILLGVAVFLVKIAPTVKLPKKLILTWPFDYAKRLRNQVECIKEKEFEPLSAHFPLSLTLLISIIISVLVVVITVLPWINPTNRLVGVDTPMYYQWLAHMRGIDANSALTFAITNDRTLFLILLYALSFVFSPVSVVQLIPALLIPLFCIVSILTVKLVCGFRETWIYVSLIAPVSIQALGLIYSGYFANMLAVIFVYFYFILLLSRFSSGKKWSIPVLSIVSLFILFSHSWTWYIFVFSLGAFLLLEWRRTAHEPVFRKQFNWKILAVGLSVIVGLISDTARSLLFSTSASVSVFETARSNLAAPNPSFLISNLRLTTNFYLGGVFSSGLFIMLFIVGFLFMLTFKSEMSNLLVSWFVVGCLAVLFASGEAIFNRFMFLMPSLVFSSFGLSFFVRLGVYNSKRSRFRKIFFELLVVGLAILFALNFALNYLININII